MNSYTKIKSSNAVDSSGFISSPRTYESNHKTTPPQESKKLHSDVQNGVASIENRSGYAAAPELRKNRSISSFSRSTKVSAMQRAFSVGRSSSVSERYSRIHDQHVALASDEEDSYNGGSFKFNKVRKSANGGGKRSIMKACKRIFGL